MVTEYKYDEDTGERVKTVQTFRVETRRVSKAVTARRKWKKFGAAKDEDQGVINPAHTYLTDEIFMNFIHDKAVS